MTEDGRLRTEGEFSGKIGDNLFLEGFEEIFVKLGNLGASE